MLVGTNRSVRPLSAESLCWRSRGVITEGKLSSKGLVWIQKRSRSQSERRVVPTLSNRRAAIFILAVYDSFIASCKRTFGTASEWSGGSGFDDGFTGSEMVSASIGWVGIIGLSDTVGDCFYSSVPWSNVASWRVRKYFVLSGPVRFMVQFAQYGESGSSPSRSSSMSSPGCYLFQWRVQLLVSTLPHWRHTWRWYVLGMCWAGNILVLNDIFNVY